MTRPITLSDLQRAELFQGLGRTLSAGLTASQALKAVQGCCGGVLDAPLGRCAAAVAKGTAVTRTLQRHGIAVAADTVLLRAGESTGTLDRVCEHLAARYTRAGIRWRQLKGKLMLPGAVLVVAILVLPIPALASGSLSVNRYVLQAGAMLALLAMLTKLSVMLIQQWRALGTPGWLTHLARVLPGIGAMSRLHQRADACERLSLSLTCGLSAAQALEALHRDEPNVARRADLATARAALDGGAGVADAMGHAGLLDAAGYAIVSTGEGAGRVDQMLQRVASHCHEALDGAYALLSQWIPVAVYLLVAGIVAIGLIG